MFLDTFVLVLDTLGYDVVVAFAVNTIQISACLPYLWIRVSQNRSNIWTFLIRCHYVRDVLSKLRFVDTSIQFGWIWSLGKWVWVSSSSFRWVQVNSSELKLTWIQKSSSDSKWLQVNSTGSKSIQGSSSESKWVQVNSSESKWVQASSHEFKWARLKSSEFKWVQVTSSEF